MASNALEEKINKINLQNEEIRRRYEEVEADKRNAAKLNALVQMVPSSDWPIRKEPPEFTRIETPKSNFKPKIVKKHSDRPQQWTVGGEGKKTHKFAQGDGPPPDPKYNFLADAEREEHTDGKRSEERPKGVNKHLRNGPRRRVGGRDGYQKDQHGQSAASREGPVLEYDAWRAERNRIDEARINRQRTAEGNWRREWDNDKTHVEKDSSKKDSRFLSNDSTRRDHKDFERRHQFDVEHFYRGRGGNPRSSYGPKNYQNHYDNQHLEHSNEYPKILVKGPLSPVDDRTIIATDKSIKVTVNQGATPVKGPVMSVKVNAPSIAGTGRVGPRQKTRVTYSSQSEVEVTTHQIDNFSRQKSFDEKVYFNSAQRSTVPKSPYPPKKKETGAKSPYPQRKDTKRNERPQKHGECVSKSPYPQKKGFKDTHKSPQIQRRAHNSINHASISPRARVQNQFNEDKIASIKMTPQPIGNNESAEGIAIEKPVEIEKVYVDLDSKVSEISNFSTDTIIKDMKTPQEKVEKEPVNDKELNQGIDNARDTNSESAKVINNEITNHESTVLLKLEENKSEISNEIPSNIEDAESDINLENKICEKIENDDKANSENLNKEIHDLIESPNLKDIDSENYMVEKYSSTEVNNEKAEISKDEHNEISVKMGIVVKNEILDDIKIENDNKDFKKVNKSEISETLEIHNNDTVNTRFTGMK